MLCCKYWNLPTEESNRLFKGVFENCRFRTSNPESQAWLEGKWKLIICFVFKYRSWLIFFKLLKLENLHYPKLHMVNFFFLCKVVQMQVPMCCTINNIFEDFYMLLGISLLSNRNYQIKIGSDSTKRQFLFELLCVCLWVGQGKDVTGRFPVKS